jgi:ribosomal protein S18 acetylase RimI-like enzyme
MEPALDTITIRPLSKKDQSIVQEMMLDTYRNNPAYASHSELQSGFQVGQPLTDGNIAYIREHCECHTKKRTYSGLVAVDETQRILGVVLMQKHSPKGTSPWGELSDIILAPKQRSDGLGQMLLSRAIAVFRKWGVDQVFLETGVDNKKAHRFFIGQGWKVVSHTMRITTALPQLPTTDPIPTTDLSPDTPKQNI